MPAAEATIREERPPLSRQTSTRMQFDCIICGAVEIVASPRHLRAAH
jgi:hypothetical protein